MLLVQSSTPLQALSSLKTPVKSDKMYQIKFKLSSAHSPEDFGYLTVVKKSLTNSPKFQGQLRQMFLSLKCKEVLETEKCLLINFSDEMGGDAEEGVGIISL